MYLQPSWKNVWLLICYYCLGLGWGFLYFSLMRVTLLSLVYQKTCNRLSSTNFQEWRNMNDAHILETWPLDPAYLFLNYASCMMWWAFGSEFVTPTVKCSVYMLISCTIFFNDSSIHLSRLSLHMGLKATEILVFQEKYVWLFIFLFSFQWYDAGIFVFIDTSHSISDILLFVMWQLPINWKFVAFILMPCLHF